MGSGTLRALKVAVVVMGVLIVAGTATLAVLLARRVTGAGPPATSGVMRLDEPAGTRIVGASEGGSTVLLVLSGGGPDRVVMVDPRGGRVVGRVELAR